MRISFPLATLLSRIVIDVTKNWGGHGITNLGDVNVGANLYKTTNLAIKEHDATSLVIRNAADTADRYLRAAILFGDTFQPHTSTAAILQARGVDGAYLVGRAKDTGVAQAEIFRMVGATTAYFNLISGRARMDDIDLRSHMLIWGLMG